MPRCRKEKKVPLRNDDMIGDIRNSAFRGRENNLRDYGDYADSRMKQVFYRTKPENIMKEDIYGQRFYNLDSNLNADMYGYKKASNIYNDKSSNPRSHQQWNDYDRTRPVNLYKADDNLYTREIREPFEPRQIPRAPNPPNSLYNEVPVSRNFRDAYEPQYIPVKTVRSNNYLDDISESR
ncbi:hypothetical protein KSF78_0003955 [Schistosoma japonicum]|nr:hypothetical protein KSF78_0003955 [Schistosoma japonicum]KAH8868283.1 hypothetical protein KSF78_0003955 [Schistosoma japonicum]